MVRHVTEVESHLFQVNCSIICCFVFIVWPFLDSAGGANALMKSYLHDSDSVFCSSSQKFQALYALFGILFFATDLTRTVTELQSQPTEMQRSMDHAEAAQGLFIPVAMIFFFTLLLVG